MKQKQLLKPHATVLLMPQLLLFILSILSLMLKIFLDFVNIFYCYLPSYPLPSCETVPLKH